MSKTRFTQWIVLACIGSLAACTSGEGGTAGNTELNVIVPNGYDAGSSAPALIDIQDVEYTIDCAGNSDTFLDNNASFPDEVTLNGNLEVQDGRTNAAAIYGDPAIDGQAEIWQGFMDLPPGPCTIELRARDNDGEVICTAQEPFSIAADSTTKVNIVLICDISFQAPVGMLDVDGTFSFNVGNFCPDLFILNCLDSMPAEQQVLPPPNPPLAGTGCQVRFRDGDSTCGQGCDPQTCVPNGLVGLTCTPGPDPGVSTIVSCDADTLLDCQGDGVPDASCTFTGDTEGTLGQQPPTFPGLPGVGGFFITCLPPALGGTPGATATCTAVTTDGDLDCDKTKVVDVSCPGLTQCNQYAADGAVCDDGNECTVNACEESPIIPGGCGLVDNGPCCSSTNVADTTTCTLPGGPAECQAGVCTSLACTNDAQCADTDSNSCTAPQTCDLVVGSPTEGQCIPEPPANEPAGTACAPDPSCVPADGTCDGAGACGATNECAVAGDCPNTPAAPADPQCTAAVCNTDVCGNTCSIDLTANSGSTCDFSGPGSADGQCIGTGECIFSPDTCNFANNGNDATPTSGIVGVGCTNNVTTAQSPFPFTLVVNVPEAVIGGASFNASFDGIGVFPEFFLDAAQAVVPGGVDIAELVDIVSTVQVRSGATGPDVPLLADLGSLSPGPTSFCTFTFPDNSVKQVCNVDADCAAPTAVPPCLPPVDLATLPNSTDCSVGGACDLLGKLVTQCTPNGFCITGDLVIEFLESAPTAYTAAASGNVLFGWADQGVPDLTLCPAAAPNCQDTFMPDGCYDLPAAVFAAPTAPIGIRVNASGLFVPIQCAGGTAGGICASGEGCIVDGDCATAPCTITADVICPTPDSGLLSCPIN